MMFDGEPETALQKLAYHLASEDYDFKFNLVDIREKSGLSQEEVGERIGITVESVKEFEAYWSDPSLSTIRRYALAIGVSYVHKIQALDGE